MRRGRAAIEISIRNTITDEREATIILEIHTQRSNERKTEAEGGRSRGSWGRANRREKIFSRWAEL